MSLGHSPSIVTSGLVLCVDAANTKSYPGSGTTWADLSGNAINGTLTNGPTYNTSNGGSIVFTSSTNYVNFLQNSLFNFGTSDFTIEAWIYPTSFPQDPTIFMMHPYTSPNNTGMILYVSSAGKVGSYFGSSTSFTGNTTVSLNTWSHVILTRASGTNYIYLNGSLDISTTVAGTFNITGHTNVAIGRDISYNNCPWVGRISNIKIYNKSFSAAEVSQNFNALRVRYGI